MQLIRSNVILHDHLDGRSSSCLRKESPMSNFPKSMEPEEDALPFSSTVTFLHAVGQSTLRQGIAVPVIAQIDWIANIRKGQAVPVTIAFGEGQSVTALLRRIRSEERRVGKECRSRW